MCKKLSDDQVYDFVATLCIHKFWLKDLYSRIDCIGCKANLAHDMSIVDDMMKFVYDHYDYKGMLLSFDELVQSINDELHTRDEV